MAIAPNNTTPTALTPEQIYIDQVRVANGLPPINGPVVNSNGQTIQPQAPGTPGTPNPYLTSQGADPSVTHLDNTNGEPVDPNALNNYGIGGAFGYTNAQVIDQMNKTSAADQSTIIDATKQGQANLATAANASYGRSTDLLNNAYTTAATQAAQGSNGLEKAAALADYNNQLGSSAMTNMAALGQQATEASARYGAQGDALLTQQQAIAQQGYNQLGAMSTQAQGAVNNLNAAATANNAIGAGYTGQAQVANGAAGQTQQTAGQQFANLSQQGVLDRNNLSTLGDESRVTADQLATKSGFYGNDASRTQGVAGQQLNSLGQQGALDRNNLSTIGSAALGTASQYQAQGAQQNLNQNQDRTQALQSIAALNQFYNRGPGPSAAQAQLAQSSNQAQSDAISLARSGRGIGANAENMRQAQFVNAATQQNTGMQLAQLRAQEEAAWRSQQLGAMGQEQGALSNLRGQDVGALQAVGALGTQYANLGQQGYQAAGQLGQAGTGAAAQGYANLGAQQIQQMQSTGALGAQYANLGQQGYQSAGQLGQAAAGGAGQGYTNLGAQQNQSAQTMGQLGLGYNQLGQTGVQAAGNLGLQAGTAEQQAWQNYNQQAAAAATGAGQLGATYANLGKDYYTGGIQAQQGYGNLANQSLGTGLNYSSSMTGNANQATGQGLNASDSAYTQGNQLTSAGVTTGIQGANNAVSVDQANQANKVGVYSQQQNSDTTKYGINNNVAVANAAAGAQQTAGILGAVGTVIGGVAGGVVGGPGGAAAGAAAGGAGGSAIGKATSDKRAKKNIRYEARAFKTADTLAERMEHINKFSKKVA